MSAPPPTINPSQTVERIREIIVGRHLERLESRVERLETAIPPQAAPAANTIFEDRLLQTEARVEALHDHVHRIENGQEEFELRAAQHRQEAQRLAGQIQEIARENAAALPAVEQLERKLGVWLNDWQKSLHLRLEDRDRKLATQLKGDLGQLRESLESRLALIESRVPENVEERFSRIAAAARALAESAAPSHQPAPIPG